MAISKNDQVNIDDSNLTAYPNGQVKDDSGTGDGFPLTRDTTSDHFETFDKAMRLADITFNGDFDNEVNGYQYLDAFIALAAKSDYILSLTTSTGILQLPTKLGILNENEKLIALAVSDYTTETQIRGNDSPTVTKSIIITQQWKAGDYLLLVNTTAGVKIIQLVTGDNLAFITTANAFLKAANNAETLAGAIITKAVTPASFLSAFTSLVTVAVSAAPYYATDSTPGLLSAADKTIIDNFADPVKNRGWFSGVDAGGGTVGSFYTRSGNITTAQITAVDGGGSWTQVRVTMANAMTGTTYFVRLFAESLGTFTTDVNIQALVFKPFSTTQFDFIVQQGTSGGVQNLKIHCEVVQIS